METLFDFTKNKASSALSTLLKFRILSKRSKVVNRRLLGHVAIVAPLRKDNGITAGARYQHEAFTRIGVKSVLIDATESLRNPYFDAKHQPATAYIFHCGGPQTANMLWSVMPHAYNAYRIAYWAWELPDPPSDWKGYDLLVDEIWTPSNFSFDSLKRISSKPLHVVPHVVGAQPVRRKINSKVFNVLTLADSRSSFARKNPAGAVAAFRAAFGDSESAHLYVKLSGRADDVNTIRKELRLSESKNISVIDRRLSEAEMIHLYNSMHVTLSLHRSEGFGLPMLESMACGTPVVATSWSGNVDFLNTDNGVPVDYRIVPVNDPYNIYKNGVWADPLVEDAALKLRQLSTSADRLECISVAAFSYVSQLRPNIPLR